MVFFHAIKWFGKSPGLCSSNGKIKLPFMEDPLEPLCSLIIDQNITKSALFTPTLKKYTCEFQINSFRGKKNFRENVL